MEVIKHTHFKIRVPVYFPHHKLHTFIWVLLVCPVVACDSNFMSAGEGLKSFKFVFKSSAEALWCSQCFSLARCGSVFFYFLLFSVFNCLGNEVPGRCSCEDVLNVIIWTVFLIACSLETPFGKPATVFGVVRAFLHFMSRTLIAEVVVCMFPFLSIQNMSWYNNQYCGERLEIIDWKL